MSVPYALYAGSAGGSSVTGDDGDLDTSNVAVFTNKSVGIGTGFPAGGLNVVNDNNMAVIGLQGAGDNFTYSAIELGNRENDRFFRITQSKLASERNNFVIDYWDGTQ